MSGYAILRADEAPDYTGDAPGAFLGYGRTLGAEQVAVNMRVLPPGTRHIPPGVDPDSGHSHRTIEEIYLVVEGEVTIKLGEEIETLRQYDAVRVEPGTVRAVRNESDAEARLVMISVPIEDLRAESEWHPGFWPG